MSAAGESGAEVFAAEVFVAEVFVAEVFAAEVSGTGASLVEGFGKSRLAACSLLA